MIQDSETQRRLKISNSLKGRVPWNKGLKNWRVITDETRKKIGLAHKGKKVTVSEDTRKKISQTLKGKKPKNLTYLHSIPFTKERKNKISASNKGKIMSEETKRKISESKRDPLRPLIKAIRECYLYREWRNSVFKRDNYTCVICSQRGGTIHADHHPKRFIDIVRTNKITTMKDAFECTELWDIINGRVLCVQCHKNTDTWGFKMRSKK